MSDTQVVVLGAGPIGLVCAAHLPQAELPWTVLESGDCPATAVRAWGHVRLFSPWSMDLDPLAVGLLSAHGWEAPAASEVPTGTQLVGGYLKPLAQVPELSSNIRYGAHVKAVARRGRNLVDSDQRADEPFVIRYFRNDADHDLIATVVIDATGTWGPPNPLGVSGTPALGEASARDRIHYGIPDIVGAEPPLRRTTGPPDRQRPLRSQHAHRPGRPGRDRARHRRDLAGARRGPPSPPARRSSRPAARSSEPGCRSARGGDLGRGAPRSGRPDRRCHRGWRRCDGQPRRPPAGPFDQIVATTNSRPDLTALAELRLDLDPATEAPPGLAALTDPNTRSSLYVQLHGVEVLTQPKAGFYVVRMKSYGRAPSFLLQTGYEQVRSVVAAVAAMLAGEGVQNAVHALAGAGR